MANQLAMEFDELINQGVVSLETSSEWIELNLPNSMLFGSGDAEPHYDSFEVIEKIAGVMRNRDNAVKVEGFTDNQPIRTSRFPSNWELSTARAAAVARMLMMEGIEPERLAAVGYGQYQPVARNDTDEGRRRRNRRVVLLISPGCKHPGGGALIRRIGRCVWLSWHTSCITCCSSSESAMGCRKTIDSAFKLPVSLPIS